MGFPGDTLPPANHSVCLGILGVPGGWGPGKPPSRGAALSRDWPLERSEISGPLLPPAKATGTELRVHMHVCVS